MSSVPKWSRCTVYEAVANVLTKKMSVDELISAAESEGEV
jgi:hypothetical protein